MTEILDRLQQINRVLRYIEFNCPNRLLKRQTDKFERKIIDFVRPRF